MKNNSDQALVGTDAIKAFTTQFGPMDNEYNKIVLEELLKCLLEFKENNNAPRKSD